jgi:hypothetical protein
MKLLGRLAFLTAALSGLSAHSQAIMPPDPVHSWLFDNGSGSTATAHRGGINGTLNGSVSWNTSVPIGYTGNHSIDLPNAVGSNVNFGTNVVPHQDDAWPDFTVSVWFKPTTADIGVIVSDFELSDPDPPVPLGSRGDFYVRYRGDTTGVVDFSWWIDQNIATRSVTSTTPALFNQWNHVVITSDDNGSIINMVLNGESTGPGQNNQFLWEQSGPFTVGELAGLYPFGGQVDELALWDSVLVPESLDWLRQNSLSTFPALPTESADFDGDDDVDGADFLTWQRNLGVASGATRAMGDANIDGDVDADDLAAWRADFGTIPGPGTVAIPEPSSFILSSLVVVTGLIRALHRRI